MKAETRDVLADTMIQDWKMIWTHAPGMRLDEFDIRGTSAEAIAEFKRRYAYIPLTNPRLVMDDGMWTIRATLESGGVQTVFAGDEQAH